MNVSKKCIKKRSNGRSSLLWRNQSMRMKVGISKPVLLVKRSVRILKDVRLHSSTKNVNLWAVYLCCQHRSEKTCSTMLSMSSSVQGNKSHNQTMGEIDWNAQRGVFPRLWLRFSSSKSISYYVGFVACCLWCTRKVDRKITRFGWQKWTEERKKA